MTRTFDNMPQGNAELSLQGTTECQEDNIFWMKREKEFHKQTQKCHHYLGECKNYDYRKSSVDSGYQTKEQSQCQVEPTLLRSSGVNQDAVKAPFLSHGVEIEIKCGNRQSERKRKDTRICLSVSFMGNIVLMVIVVLLFSHSKNIVDNGENCTSRKTLQDSLCVPCNTLESQATEEDTLFDVIITCGFKFCCVKNDTIQKLFLLMVQEGYTSIATTNRRIAIDGANVNRTLSTWRSRQIAAHLYANIASLPEKLSWETDTGFGTAFLSGITLIDESRLMVPRAGYYFIYSAVTFKCQHNSKSHTHLINRQHRGRPIAGVQQLLLRKSSECGPDGFVTSFLSGVLKLTSNDEISVNVTEDSVPSVYASSLSNFFGCYVL